MAAARDMVMAAAETELWSLTDRQLAVVDGGLAARLAPAGFG